MKSDRHNPNLVKLSILAVVAIVLVFLGLLARRQMLEDVNEQAQHYYQQGVDLQTAGKMPEAKAAFESVLQLPTSTSVNAAKQRLEDVNNSIAKAQLQSEQDTYREQQARIRAAQQAAELAEKARRFESDPDNALPRYSLSELSDVFMSRQGGSQLEGKRIRLTGTIKTLSGNAVGFMYSPRNFMFLWFHINNLKDAELDPLKEGTEVDVVCTYAGVQRRTDTARDNYASMTYDFEGEEIRPH